MFDIAVRNPYPELRLINNYIGLFVLQASIIELNTQKFHQKALIFDLDAQKFDPNAQNFVLKAQIFK